MHLCIAAQILLAAAAHGAVLSNVEVWNFNQVSLNLSCLLTWETDTDNATDLIDVWFLVMQANPSSWIERVIMKVSLPRT